ncbi:MAG: hypothetical protein ABI882_00855 [Acidobacteriota bacterium]
MFCPNCGTQINEALKFCKRCGANLLGVREAMTRTGGETFDWGKTWVANMMLSEDERERRKGITPEEKRYNEIKAGIITAVAGLGAMIFFRLFMPAIAASEPPPDAAILLRLWVIGVVPFLIGLSIIFNGVFLGKRVLQARERQKSESGATSDLGGRTQVAALPDPSVIAAPDFSVVEPTTRRIPEPADAQGARGPDRDPN